MEMTLELEATDRDTLLSEMFEIGERQDRVEVAISDEISLQYHKEEQRSLELAALVILLLNIPVGVAINVVTEQIASYLRRKDQGGRIKSAVITYTEEVNGRKRTVEKRIEIDDS
ncbi:hypothetical protein [Streptomyces sp. A30]|uniref:hypothetical protein n=1 Tax=Streptomyces sp. A30 TaxID=2789273 RepID=UPI0039806ECD